MTTENNNFEKKMMKILNEGFGEDTSIKCMMTLGKEDKEIELNEIGSVKDFKSEYKNDIFENIYEDENGVIIDCRIHEFPPTDEELENYIEYWEELRQAFDKPVQPVFIIYGER